MDGRRSTGSRSPARCRCLCRAAARIRLRRSSIVPSSGWTASCPPLLVADRPWRAWIARSCDQRVVCALAVRQADRVDRRQVEDVESELGEQRELALDPVQTRPTSAGTAHTTTRIGARRRSTSIASGRASVTRAVCSCAAPTASSNSRAERDVVLGRLGHASGRSAVASACSMSCRVSAHARPRAPPAAATAPSDSSPREVELAGGELAAAARRARSRSDRSRHGPSYSQSPDRSTSNSAAQRTPPSARRCGASAPRASCWLRGAAVSGRPRAAGRGRRGRCRPTR